MPVYKSETARHAEAPAIPESIPCTLKRRVLLGAALMGVGLGEQARAEEDDPGREQRPGKGDLFVFADGVQAGEVVTPAGLKLGGPPVLAWPMDPASKVVRNGSRLNQVLLIRLDDTGFDDETLPRAADGILAYSAICTHAGCLVTGWVHDAEKTVMKCFCHNSEYVPQHGATVVFGPAPRHLAALPLAMENDTLVVRSGFVGRLGPQLG